MSAYLGSVSWSGTIIDGRRNNTFHYLSPGMVHLQATYSDGGDATVYLDRDTSSIEGFDKNYGSVYASKTSGTYTFPDKADVASEVYYLVVSGPYSDAIGTLYN